jgi:hypothetical protein
MNYPNHQTVIKRGGFLSAVAYGFFGLLTAAVVSVAVLGVYAIHVVDRKLDTVLGLGTDVIRSLPESLPQIRKSLPPALADALNDERDVAYRENLHVEAHLVPGSRDEYQQLVVNAKNNGDKTVTFMAVRVVLVDANDVPVRSLVVHAATPMTLDSEWRGPILPGSLRQCSEPLWRCPPDLKPQLEIADLRVWSGPQPTPVEALAQAATAPID